MILSRKLKIFLLLLGDFLIFYLALFSTLILRYQSDFGLEVWKIHKWPFFYIHILWIAIFYISGLYDIKTFISPKNILERIIRSMIIAGILSALIFYLIPTTPSFKIAPKTTLAIDVLLVTLFLTEWRRIFRNFISKSSKIKTLFFGTSKEVEDLAKHLKNNDQLGYEPTVVLKSIDHNFIEIIKKHNIQLIVASKNIMQNENATKRLYEVLPLGVSTVDFPSFYETIREKIPVSSINEIWFLENLTEINKRMFKIFKRIFDIIGAIFLGIPTLIILPLIALCIKTESRGPIILKQKRTGKNENTFYLFKFRSMYALCPDGSAEIEITGWEKPKGKDKRLTRVGNILRKTRIDELPQLWNILKGEMSFIGPRPERPKYVKFLKKEVPHYSMRHLVKPGVSGWSQIKFTSASAKDAMEKLQFDLYYIKNRSIILDLAIAARTLATVISRQGK